MNRDELGLETYVVLGNALHLLCNGIGAEEQERLGLPMQDLQPLYARLEPVRPNEILSELHRLRQPQRALLAGCIELAVRIAGPQSDAVLGASSEIRVAIIDLLRSGMSLPTPTTQPGDPA